MLVAFYAKLWYDEKRVIPGVARRVGEAPAPVVIGDNVWIGGGAIILPGVTIGNKDNNKSEVEERGIHHEFEKSSSYCHYWEQL